MMDFVKNTYDQLLSINSERLAAGDRDESKKMTEVIGRNQFASVLVNDNDGVDSIDDNEPPPGENDNDNGEGNAKGKAKRREIKSRQTLAMITGVDLNDPSQKLEFGPDIRARLQALMEV
jgi:hypothetical protein